MGGKLIVTFEAIMRYKAEARAAQEQLDEAKAEMKKAASELCEQWKGDAADAFAQEQGILDSWYDQLISIVTEYLVVLDAAVKKYQELEIDLANKISG